jgi:hypothetical protein
MEPVPLDLKTVRIVGCTRRHPELLSFAVALEAA